MLYLGCERERLHTRHLGLQLCIYYSPLRLAGWLKHFWAVFSGDGCGFIVQKRMADWVDGKQVLIEGEPLVASICGSGCATIGMGAAMNAPHGPSEQELVAQTLKTAPWIEVTPDTVGC